MFKGEMKQIRTGAIGWAALEGYDPGGLRGRAAPLPSRQGAAMTEMGGHFNEGFDVGEVRGFISRADDLALKADVPLRVCGNAVLIGPCAVLADAAPLVYRARSDCGAREPGGS